MTTPANILIVDDEAMTRDILEGYLAKERYNLTFASNGFEALGMLEKTFPDVILLDILMPYLNGFEVCHRLKEDRRWRHIPIILITALGSKEDIIRGLDAGADDFLHKPVNDQELRARVRSMLRIKKQYDQLQLSLQFKDNIAHMLADGMRTPITAIMGYSSLLHTIKNMPPESLREAKKIYFQTQRLNGLLNDMLMLVKMEENGQLKVNLSAINLDRLIQRVEEDHQIIAQLKGITIVNDLPEQAPQVWADQPLIKRVLDNLISNAIKFSPAKSTVTVRLQYPVEGSEKDGPISQVRIQVLDQGPGIPVENREYIFDRIKIMKTQGQDTAPGGLGLAFCKMVIDSHGGHIFIEDNEPVGSVFTVEL